MQNQRLISPNFQVSPEEKSNEGENIANKYLVSRPPTTEYYFEIGGSVYSE